MNHLLIISLIILTYIVYFCYYEYYYKKKILEKFEGVWKSNLPTPKYDKDGKMEAIYKDGKLYQEFKYDKYKNITEVYKEGKLIREFIYEKGQLKKVYVDGKLIPEDDAIFKTAKENNLKNLSILPIVVDWDDKIGLQVLRDMLGIFFDDNKKTFHFPGAVSTKEFYPSVSKLTYGANVTPDNDFNGTRIQKDPDNPEKLRILKEVFGFS